MTLYPGRAGDSDSLSRPGTHRRRRRRLSCRRRRVVCTGDFLTAALSNMSDAFVNEWVTSLDELKKLDFDTVLPGHGEAFTDKAKIDYFQAYLRDVWTEVGRLKTTGCSGRTGRAARDLTKHKRSLSRHSRSWRASDRGHQDLRASRRCGPALSHVRIWRRRRTTMSAQFKRKRPVSRRQVLRTGAAALGGSAAFLAGTADASTPVTPRRLPCSPAHRPAARSADSSATRTRLDVQELRLRPVDPRQVVIRSLAVAPCYTIVRGALGDQLRSAVRRFRIIAASASSRRSAPMVKRVQVGDRVVVAGTSQCGQCYQCLHGRPDYCQFTFSRTRQASEPFPAVRRNARRHALSTRRPASAA